MKDSSVLEDIPTFKAASLLRTCKLTTTTKKSLSKLSPSMPSIMSLSTPIFHDKN